MQELPESFGNLENLEELKIEECTLEELPENFGNLKNLKKLSILSTPLKKLPKSFSNLVNLEELKIINSDLSDLSGETGYKLFDELANLKNLKTNGWLVSI